MMGQRGVYASVGTCFLLSGFAALLYQTAWMRQLSTVFGASELAVATVLSAYMGGLVLGAAVAARFIDRINRPVLTYGVLEGVIAITALLVPSLFDFAGWIYEALLGRQAHPPDASGWGQSLFYLAATFVILVVPTACMGATLPMLNRYAVREDAQIGRRVGALYAINTAGAIGGTLVAAFYLLPTVGLNGAVWVGALINFIIFAIAAPLSRTAASPHISPQPAGARPNRARAATSGFGRAGIILPVMLVSGMASFTYEVLWTRLLAHILGGSVVAFATMLASFLAGIALGSAIAAWLAKDRTRAQMAFVVCQLMIAVSALGVYVGLQAGIPEVAGMGQNVLLAIAIMLPATLFIGATFPLAVRIFSGGAADAARASAKVYAWNTAGAIGGAIITGFVLLPLLRYEGVVQVATASNGLLALAMAVTLRKHKLSFATLSGGLLAVLLFVQPAAPEALLRVSPLNDLRTGALRYYDVGRSATVLMLERDGYLYLRTNGLPEASIDMRGAPPAKHTQRLLSTLPIIARPELERMLIVGLGGGVVAESVPASVQAIDIIELEPKVVAANRHLAAERQEDPLADPRVRIIVNDARNALRLTDARYDALVSQPSHPWTAGASHLYTREFMRLAASRLTDSGVFLQWINLQFASEALLKSLGATLLDVFPHVRAYHFEPMVLFFLASKTPIQPEAALIASGAPLTGNPQAFRRKGVGSVNDMVAALAWDTPALRRLSAGAQVNTDNDNQMAMRSFGGFESKSLTYERVKALIKAFGPVYDAQSDIHRHQRSAINFVYVAERLATMHAPELSTALRTLLEESSHPQSPAIAAHFSRKAGRSRLADRAALEALRRQPSDAIASYLLFQERGERVTDGSLPARVQPYIDNLSADALAVLRSWSASRRGDDDEARALDPVLAAAPPHQPWFLRAAQLRVNWRVQAVRSGESTRLAVEAMSIIDDAIALQQDLDFYGMRMVASFLAGNHDATAETARRMIGLLRDDLEFKRLSTETPLALRDLEMATRRLQSIAGGLDSVREADAVARYKIDDVEQQLEALRRTIERWTAQRGNY